MNLTVFGPTGGTGSHLLIQALEAGHHVKAVARRPETVALSHERLEVIKGDVFDPPSLAGGISGADAVLSAIGSHNLKEPTTVYSAGTSAIVAAMKEAGVTRFVGVSATPVEPDSQKAFLERYFIHPLLYRFFGGGYDDMRKMETLLASSMCDWTVFRPPRLTDGEVTHKYRTAVDRPLARAWNLRRADLAAAMLASIDDTAVTHCAVTIAN